MAACAGQYAPGGHGVAAALPRGQYPPAAQLTGAAYAVAHEKAGGHSPHVTRRTLFPVFCATTYSVCVPGSSAMPHGELKALVPRKPLTSALIALVPASVVTSPVSLLYLRTLPPNCSIQNTFSAVSTAM